MNLTVKHSTPAIQIGSAPRLDSSVKNQLFLTFPSPIISGLALMVSHRARLKVQPVKPMRMTLSCNFRMDMTLQLARVELKYRAGRSKEFALQEFSCDVRDYCYSTKQLQVRYPQRYVWDRCISISSPQNSISRNAKSALDSESEQTVKEALDKVMGLEHQTTIVVAHRLSTIRNADRIAVIMNGKVAEIGSYEELMSKQKSHFRRLQAFQNVDDAPINKEQKITQQNVVPHTEEEIEKFEESYRRKKEKMEEELRELEAIDKEREKRNSRRAREFAKGNEWLFLIGSIGAVLAGAVFPVWGIIFAYMVELLYTPVEPCFDTNCEEEWGSIADDMKNLSNNIAYGSIGTIFASLIGYVLLFYGFGTATEKLNKRVRDAAFEALVRQEVAWFDLHPVGKLTSQLQEDAALIHSFSGEPIRTLVINVSSVVVGLVLGFIYMW